MTPLLDIRNLSRDYARPGFFGGGERVLALRNVDLSLQPGEMLALAGLRG